ncbi:IS110 family transposase [Planomonospora sp. ID82291]|uniref:IS110 family transposase n=1 Tax=Planomonospora sp. ID82291 TaxID=2738136 RepID=UPI0018C3E5AB|nr:IS110 family transposase [Planomonospora sp. ID82291]MBG0814030.1 IS110 family transposase [Planomonospora sp. ID82291]MBG0814156.1 IS110 family transposase [Planomonospora sp. ID82291]MBG0816185.1 IS110 family transposase [Planomonospora sp. ID82291]MBG0817224.1 IS110 family transposase [Planomonospora sp. ID82291]
MLFVGDDWAEDHHDVEVQDEQGRVLKRVRLPEGMAGMSRFHELVGRFVPEDGEPAQVLVCIEVDRGPWVRALRAAGYRVFGVDPKQAARHREILGSSGAKSDKGDAHALADMIRTRRNQLREVAGDSEVAEAVKVVTRAHQTLLWERTRHMLRLRVALRDYFPAALEAYKPLGLTSDAALKLLVKAPTPATAAKLTAVQIAAALKGRRDIPAKAETIKQVLRSEQLGQADLVTAAYASTVRALAAVIATLNTEIKTLEDEVEAHFGRHPDAEVILSQPGIGVVLGARVLAEFGDAPGRYASAKARKNYAGTSPVTRQSGKTRTVHARFVHNDRLVDALHLQASCALLHDVDARAYYDQIRARDVSHNAALRQVGNRLVGILHGCLKNHTLYDRATAWSHRNHDLAA